MRLGVSEKTVKNRCKSYGLNLDIIKEDNNQNITKEEFIKAYMEVYRAGGNTRDVAKILGCSLTNVRNRARTYQLPGLNRRKKDPDKEFSSAEICKMLQNQQAKMANTSPLDGIKKISLYDKDYSEWTKSAYDEYGRLKNKNNKKLGLPEKLNLD